MSSKMSSHLLTQEYNVYEETGICCTNHHICKWGVIVGIQKDIQVSQHLSLSHPSLNGRLVTVDIILGTSSSKAFVHRFIGAYTPWNPSTDDGDFWTQVAKICNDLQNSWSLTGDLNMTISVVEHPSGGTDARQQYSRFLQETNGFDLWGFKPDHTRERDWTYRVCGSSSGGNIIDYVAMSRCLNIEPPSHINVQHVLFNTHEATCLKPRIKSPTKVDKHKFGEYHTAVDKLAKEQNLSWHPVEDSQSFIIRYDALTTIFDKCAGKTFRYVKPYRGNAYQPVTSPKYNVSSHKLGKSEAQFVWLIIPKVTC